MVRKRHSWWLEIEGIAERFGFGAPSVDPQRPDAADKDDMAEQPQSLADSCDPITAELDLSSFSFAVNAHDENAELLLYQQQQPPTAFDVNLDADDSETTVIFTDEHGLEDDDSFYAGLETFRVTNVIDQTTVTANRAQYGSSAESHSLGDPVWFRVPRWRGRRCELWSAPEDKRRWVGYIEAVRRAQRGAAVVVECRHTWTAILNTFASREGASSLRHNTRGFARFPDPDSDVQTSADFIELGPLGPFDVIGREVGDTGWFQVGDWLTVGDIESQAGDTYNVSFRSSPRLGSGEDGKIPGLRHNDKKTFGYRSLFAIVTVDDDGLPGFAEPSSDGASTINADDSPYFAHPANIALFLLTDQILDAELEAVLLGARAPRFTLGASGLFGDGLVESVRTLIERNPDLQVDHFILGWDGDEFDVVEVVAEKLLRPYGYFFGVTQDGRPTIARFGVPTAEEMEEVENDECVVEPLPGPWVGEYSPRYEDSVDVVTAKVGGAPWREPETIEMINVGAGSGRTRLGDARRWDIDYSTVHVDRADDVEHRAKRLAKLSAFGFPKFRFRAPDTDKDNLYDIGGLIRLDRLPVKQPYLLDRDGNLVDDVTDDDHQLQFYGLIISREFVPSNKTYELEVMLTSWRTQVTRLRAPSAIVEGTGEFDELRDFITVREDGFHTTNNHNGEDFDEIIDAPFTIDICDQTFSPKETHTVEILNHDQRRMILDDKVSDVTDGDVVQLGDYNADATLGTTGLVAYNFYSGEDGEPGHTYG